MSANSGYHLNSCVARRIVPIPDSLAFASKEQLPRWISTATPSNAAGVLKGEQPSGGSAVTSDSCDDAVEVTSAASVGPKLASMTVYDTPSAPPPYAAREQGLSTSKAKGRFESSNRRETMCSIDKVRVVHDLSNIKMLALYPEAAGDDCIVDDTVEVQRRLVDREGAAVCV